jgi:transcriptional regulator with XRE-family HTH domain
MVDRPIKKPLPMFALRLRRARLNTIYRGARMRQVDAADLCGVAHKTYWRWENGKMLPLPEHLERIAEVLGLSVDEVWLDVGFIPPDMQEFLVTTREGMKVVQNIRQIMTVLDENQKPTTRREAPVAEQFAKKLLRGYQKTAATHRKRTGRVRKKATERVAKANAERAAKSPA